MPLSGMHDIVRVPCRAWSTTYCKRKEAQKGIREAARGGINRAVDKGVREEEEDVQEGEYFMSVSVSVCAVNACAFGPT